MNLGQLHYRPHSERWGKVMFSQVSVRPQEREGITLVTDPCSFLGGGGRVVPLVLLLVLSKVLSQILS